MGEVGAHHLLAVGGAPVDDGHRCRCRSTSGLQPGRDDRAGTHAHQDHQRPVDPSEGVPVDAGKRRVAEVSGHDRDRGGHVPVGHRDPGGGRCRERRADARHDLDRDADPTEGFGLLAPAAEHERVSTLQSDHLPPRPAVLHE